MIVLHVAPINMKVANGFRFSVPGLTSSQNKIQNVNAALLNIGSMDNIEPKTCLTFDFCFFKEYKNIKALPDPFNQPDIIVFHGIYHLKYIEICKEINKKNIPYIIVPRSSLNRSAQRQKYIKKKLANILYFRKFVRKAARIHYLTENEKNTSIYCNTRDFVVGNGINLKEISVKKKNKVNNITYMGRFDINHKGLDLLIEAIDLIKFDLINNNIKVNLYGTDYKGGKKYLKNKIEQYSLNDVVILNGPVYGNSKERMLLDTDIFVATSRFEGHPMAVIEAMSYGIPCILTPGTNMLNELTLFDAGWGVKANSKEIANTILNSIKSENTIYRKGINARNLIKNKFTWEKVAKKTIENYEKLFNEEKK